MTCRVSLGMCLLLGGSAHTSGRQAHESARTSMSREAHMQACQGSQVFPRHTCTLVLTATSPDAICCPAETKETLRFAEMARAITNTPVVNREPKDELIHRLQEQVAELQDQLKTARKEGGRSATEEVLAQLNATEAALADLKEETVSFAAGWLSTLSRSMNGELVVALMQCCPSALLNAAALPAHVQLAAGRQ